MHWTRPLPVLLAAALIAAAVPSSARAGTYDVVGCNGWVPYNNSPGFVAVYSNCPGFTARNVFGGFSSPSGASGGWSFLAPGGTQITSLHLSGEFRGFIGWQAAVWSEGGGSPGGAYQLQNCPGSTCPGQYSTLGTYSIPSADAIRMRMRCGAGPCSNQQFSGAVQITSAVVTLNDVSPPSVHIVGGGLVDGNWHSGVQPVTVEATDNTGIQALRAYVDGVVRTEQPRPGCTWGALLPCPNGGGTVAVNAGGLSDGPHTLAMQVIDTGGADTTDARTILVDNTAPTSPAAIEADESWTARNEFNVRWEDPRQTAAPIVSALYRMCPVGSGDASRCVVGEVPRAAGKGPTTFKVPGSGDWFARIWLRDAAGNEAEANCAIVEHLRFDPTPPTAAIVPPDAADPTSISVRASDDVSGVAGGDVEIQRDGENLWRPLPTVVVASGLQATLDDSQFFDGTYRIRAHVVDSAGNERTTSEFVDGSSASVTLPLRIKTRLAVGRVSHVRARGSRGRLRYRRVVNTKPSPRYGRTVKLNGRLTTPGGNPVASGLVEVWEQVALPGAPWTHLANITTSRTGRFAYKALRGPSRLVQFRYGGNGTVRPRTSTVELLVRGSTSLDVDRHRLNNGEYILFHGHVRGRPLPPQGKLVELRVYTRGRWRTFAQPRANAGNGRWSYRYQFESVHGVQQFRFRARVRKEAGYPYELGTSSRVSVRVRGL